MKLNGVGRALLAADRGRVTAQLAMLQLQPEPKKKESKAVELIEPKGHAGGH